MTVQLQEIMFCGTLLQYRVYFGSYVADRYWCKIYAKIYAFTRIGRDLRYHSSSI